MAYTKGLITCENHESQDFEQSLTPSEKIRNSKDFLKQKLIQQLRMVHKFLILFLVVLLVHVMWRGSYSKFSVY